jgi:hypothetical protein
MDKWTTEPTEQNLRRECNVRRHRSLIRHLRPAVAIMLSLTACDNVTSTLLGDWDYYRMLGAKPSSGFDALRRFGFPHFAGADTTGA